MKKEIMANITRIKAGDPSASKKEPLDPPRAKKPQNEPKKAPRAQKSSDQPAAKPTKPSKTTDKPQKTAKPDVKKPFILFRPFVALAHYLRDSWHEIRQVRWPSRKATWKMFLAVIIYAALFGALIILLDLFFDWIFNLILAK